MLGIAAVWLLIGWLCGWLPRERRVVLARDAQCDAFTRESRGVVSRQAFDELRAFVGCCIESVPALTGAAAAVDSHARARRLAEMRTGGKLRPLRHGRASLAVSQWFGAPRGSRPAA